METYNIAKKRMTVQTVLAKIEDVLRNGKQTDPPAYTLILGAGASYGVDPTAKEMLGFPDAKSVNIHDKCIPVWLENHTNSKSILTENAERLRGAEAGGRGGRGAGR